MTRFFLVSFLLLTVHLLAQRGKTGDQTASGSSIINEYAPLTTNAVQGAYTIHVQPSRLNANNRFATPVSKGDLLFIIQMQGASITPGDVAEFGTITDYGSAGLNEWAEVLDVSGDSAILLACALKHSYSEAGKTQIVRVPRYEMLTLSGSSILLAPQWDGSTGGIVVIETNTDLTISATSRIDVSAKGFRGGGSVGTGSGFGVTNYSSTDPDFGAERGEGIAGSVTEYDLLGGRFGRGAPANGGGGGNSHNCGGGGGSNGGDPSGWTGTGIPSVSTASWAQAWNLESPGFATSFSTGGGRGGYSFSDNNQNALTLGVTSPVWGGDFRRSLGGFGGRPLDHTNGRLFMGGGGGGGEQNNNFGGRGGNGGGIVAIRSFGNVSGTGNIFANGANGGNTVGTAFSGGTDGAGGAGGGGCILISASGQISQIVVEAKGGNGGNQDVPNFITEAEGPGGGGGGGFIGLSNTGISTSVNGGTNGTTDSFGLTEFTPNGATKGAGGTVSQTAPLLNLSAVSDTVCTGAAARIETIQQSGLTYSWTSPLFQQPDLSVLAALDILSPVNQTYFLTSCEVSQTISVYVEVKPLPSVNAGGDSTICLGSSIILSGVGAGILTWQADSTLSDTTLSNPLAAPAESTVYFLNVTDNAGCTNSDSVTITVGEELALLMIQDTSVCQGATLQLYVSGAFSYQWQPTAPLDNSTLSNPEATLDSTATFVLTAQSETGCVTQDSVRIEVTPAQQLSISGNQLACSGTGTTLSVSGAQSVLWSPSAGLSDSTTVTTVADPSNPTSYHAIYTDENGCTGTTPAIEVTPGILPQAGFTWNQVSNFNVVFTNTSLGAVSSSWLIQNVTLNQTDCEFNFPFDNTYQVRLVVANECGTDTLTAEIVVSKVDGISDLYQPSLRCYPNPATESVNLRLPAEKGELTIYDVAGRVVYYESKSGEMFLSVNVDNWVAGIYVVSFRSAIQSLLMPLAIQR